MKMEVVEVNELDLPPADVREASTEIEAIAEASSLLGWYQTYRSAHAALESFGVDSPEYRRARGLFDRVTKIMAHPNLFMEP